MPKLVAWEQEELEVRWAVLGQQLREARLVGRAETSVGCRVRDQDGFCFEGVEWQQLVLQEASSMVN